MIFSERRRPLGFTLIEILVVIFIISIAALAATLNVGGKGNTRQLEQESYRFLQVLNLVGQTALLEQTDMGVGLWSTGYAVWRYNSAEQHWQLVKNDRVLTTHSLPEPLTLQLRVHNVAQVLPAYETTVRAPQLWFSSAGNALPAAITLSDDEITKEIDVQGNGISIRH